MHTSADEQQQILRRVLLLHLRAFLDGVEPLLLLEHTTVKTTGVSKVLRRVYNEVLVDSCASHVSYLGKREVQIEHSRDGWKNTFTNITIVGGYPLPKGFMRRARNIYETNPDYSAEAIVDIVFNEFEITNDRRETIWKLKRSFREYSTLIKLMSQWTITGSLSKIKSLLK